MVARFLWLGKAAGGVSINPSWLTALQATAVTCLSSRRPGSKSFPKGGCSEKAPVCKAILGMENPFPNCNESGKTLGKVNGRWNFGVHNLAR